MILRKLMTSVAFVAILATGPLAAQADSQAGFDDLSHKRRHSSHSDDHQLFPAFGKLSASPTFGSLFINNPQGSIPPTTGWQPFPVDTFSTYSQTYSFDPCDAVITVLNAGTYLVNALLTLAYPTPGSDGPEDLTQYVIGIIVNGQLQFDSIGSLHISTEAGQENPGLLFSASLSDLIAVPADSTIQFVIAGSSGAASSFMEVVSANATVVQVSNLVPNNIFNNQPQ